MDKDFEQDPLGDALRNLEGAQDRLTRAEEELRAQHLEYISNVIEMNYPIVETHAVIPGCNDPECRCGGNDIPSVIIHTRNSILN